MFNIKENSHLDTLGFTYAFKNNISIDLSYNHYIEGKSIDNFLWAKMYWYF